MIKKRPIDLNVLHLKFSPMAMTSILHRISGIVLFLFLPIMLYFLSLSLHSETSFQHIQEACHHFSCTSVLWIFCSALIYHAIAGIRHILMDLGFAEGLVAGRLSAMAVLCLSVISMISLGVWLWA